MALLYPLSGDRITVQQLEEALLALRGTSGEAKFRSLFSVLDEDHDGNIAIDEMAEVRLDESLLVVTNVFIHSQVVSLA